MKIAIRADGGSKIGFGHIMRSLVLAKQLSNYHNVFFVCRVDNPLTDKYEGGINKIIEEGFEVTYIDENSIIEGLKKIQADMLFTDSYDVDEEYFNETKNMFGITGYMDDMNSFEFNIDFIVNQNINALEQNYYLSNNSKLFLGTEYLLVRDDFVRKSPNEYSNIIYDIMITVGGADLFNVTYKLLHMIKEEKYNYHVIVGKSFQNVDVLEQLSIENSNISLYYNANMAEIMKKCDIAISACGSTLYELSLCGVPTIGIIVGEDQVGIANKMGKEGLILNLGWHSKLTKERVIQSIDYLKNLKNRMYIVNKQRMIKMGGAKKLCDELNVFFMRGL